MSDPVSNMEIEDVLSSIRKLVSEGEQARTRDSTLSEVVDDRLPKVPESTEEAKPEKLVLSPAFLVAVPDETKVPAPEQDDITEASDETIDNVPEVADLVWEEVEDAPAETAAATPDAPVGEPPDRRSTLEATIAELEASVASDGFEPDGSEELDEVEQMVWPGHQPRLSETVEEAELAEDDYTAAEPEPTSSDPDDVAEEAAADEASFDEDAPFDEDDELEAYLSGETGLDEAALRELVAEIVREELQGTLGERITRNVRKLVRREIYRILSSQEFD